MKKIKIVSLVLFVVMLTACFSAFGASAEEVEHQYFEAPIIPEGYTIKVDGKVDPIWTAVKGQPIANVATDAAATEATGTIKYAWDENGIYILCEIDKKAPLVTPCSNNGNIAETDDTVYFGIILGGEEMSWAHAGRQEPSDYGFCGIIEGDADGNTQGWGWFPVYRPNDMKYSYYVVDAEAGKFNVEMYFDWIRPGEAACYGPAGVGEGSVLMADARAYLHNEDSTKSVVSWNAKTTEDQMAGPYFGYIQLSGDEIDPDEIVESGETPVDVDTPDETTGDVTADETNADVTGDVTEDDITGENKNTDKKNSDSEKSPKTLDTAAIVAAVAVMSIGTAVVVSKKHR